MNIVRYSDHVIAIEGFWTDVQCSQCLLRCEFEGSGLAIAKKEGAQSNRSHQRILFHDKELAIQIWEHLKDLVQESIGNFKASGINDMFRCYQYEPGHGFIKHRDQSFFVDKYETSFYTVMIYLNDDFEGGETVFSDCSVKPQKGMCLLFLHDLEHEGLKVSEAQKYYLRTDVMYRMEEND